MATVKTYDPKKVSVIFGKSLTGFANDTFVNIARSSDGTTKVTGADGETARSINPDRTYEITVTLMQSSSGNEYLSALFAADEETGSVIMPLLIKDGSGKTLFSTDQAWITNYPESGLAVTAEENREWVIHTGAAVYLLGGNN